MLAISIRYLLVVVIIAASGCTTTRGPQRILSSKGVLVPDSTGVAGKFVAAAQESFDAAPDAGKLTT